MLGALLFAWGPSIFALSLSGGVPQTSSPPLPLRPPTLDFEATEPQSLSAWKGGFDVRNTGCKSGRRCAVVNSILEQTFSARLFQGRVVVFRCWLDPQVKSADVRFNLRTPFMATPPLRSESIPDGIEDGSWVRHTLVTYVDERIDALTLSFEATNDEPIVVDNITVETLPTASELPQSIFDAYGRIDAAITGNDVVLSELLLAPSKRRQREGGTIFNRRDMAGLKGGGSQVRSTTVTTKLIALSDEAAVVESTSLMSRVTATANYRYRIVHRDNWMKVVGTWKVQDEPATEVLDESPRSAGSTPERDFADSWVPCGLAAPDKRWPGPVRTLAATQYGDRYLKPVGNLRALMVFVNFSKGRGNPPAEEVFGKLSTPVTDWIRTTSHGRASISFTPILRWHTLPGNGEPRGIMSRYIDNVLTEFRRRDAVDYAEFDIVYIVAWRALSRDSTGAFQPRTAFDIDGSVARSVIPFDYDGGVDFVSTFVHETLHLFGLPDLYSGGLSYPNQSAVGSWDVMSGLADRPRLTGWIRAKLGWLPQSQVSCVTDELVATLTPIEGSPGPKMLVIPVSPGEAFVAELRERLGGDLGICTEGVIVYSVSTWDRPEQTPNSPSPMEVISPQNATPSLFAGACGYKSQAALSTRNGTPRLLRDPAGRVEIEVVDETLGAYKVRATRRPAGPPWTPPELDDLTPVDSDGREQWRVCRAGAVGAAEACNDLGFQYKYGFGAARSEDLARAGALFYRACELGSAAACSDVARFYAEGRGGFPKDTATSQRFYHKACDAGRPEGCEGLK
jgi:hypothetical protein